MKVSHVNSLGDGRGWLIVKVSVASGYEIFKADP